VLDIVEAYEKIRTLQCESLLMDFRSVIFMETLNWALKGLSGFRSVECI